MTNQSAEISHTAFCWSHCGNHPDPGFKFTGCECSCHDEKTALAEAAAWIAESIGYPVETKMPKHPMPQALWDALVDHVHADEDGRWHGQELTRDETASWLTEEAGRG